MNPHFSQRVFARSLAGVVFFFVIFFSLSVHAGVLDTGPISSCGELAVVGTYTLNSDVGTSSEVCFIVTSNGVQIISSGTTTINGNISNVGFPVTLGGKVVNNGVISGDALFNEAASNTGTVNGNATVLYPSVNPIGGTVSGFLSYHGYPNFPLSNSTFPSTGLQAYWKLNESYAGTSAFGADFSDISGNNRNATSTKISYGVLSDYGGNTAAGFNGVSSYILTPQFNLPAGLTLSAWIKPNSLGGVVFSELGQSAINTIWHNSQMEVETDGTVKIGLWTGTPRYINAGTVTFNTWHHVVLTSDPMTNTLTGYVDGVQGDSATFVRQAPNAGSAYYAIGATDTTNGGNGNYFSGSIGDVGVWNRALSGSEVSQMFSAYKSDWLYYVGIDGDWSNISNWWQDSGYIIPALSLPVSGDLAFVFSNISTSTNSNLIASTTVFSNSNFGEGLILEGNAIFKDVSENQGVINGNVNFNDSSFNTGVVNGNADVYFPAPNPLGGTVSGLTSYHKYITTLYYDNRVGDADWNSLGNWWNDSLYTSQAEYLPANGDTVYIDGDLYIGPTENVTLNKIVVGSINNGEIGAHLTGTTGKVEFQNYSYNDRGSTINGNATFKDDSYNYRGTIIGDAEFNGRSENYRGTVMGNAFFWDSSENLDRVSGTATFNDFSYNSGTVIGDAIFTSAFFDTNFFRGANPQQGTVNSRTIFLATTTPTFTLRNEDIWNANPSSWEFTITPVWVFTEHSKNNGTIQQGRFYDNSDMKGGSASECLFYQNSTYSAHIGCASVTYQRPFYFNNASSTRWDDLGNWSNNSLMNEPALTLPNNGDVVYISSAMTEGPSVPVSLNKIYVGSENKWTSYVSPNVRDSFTLTGSSDLSKIFIGGKPGNILMSTTSGETWVQKSNSARNWHSIASSDDGEILYGVVRYDGVYTSYNQGVDWTKRIGLQKVWSSIATSKNGAYAAAIAEGDYIYVTSNYGVDWTKIDSFDPQGWTWVTSSYDGSRFAAVSYGGYVYTSDNHGETWIPRPKSGQRFWASITSSGDGKQLVAVEERGGLYISEDYGDNWKQIIDAGIRNWKSVSSSEDGRVILAGTYVGSLYISLNFGKTWTEQTMTYGEIWWPVLVSRDGSRFAAMGARNIYTSGMQNFSVDFKGASGDAYFYGDTENAGFVDGTLHIFGNRLLADVNHGTISGDVEFNDKTGNNTLVPGHAIFTGLNTNLGTILGGGENYGVLSGNGTTTGIFTNYGEISGGNFLSTVTNMEGSTGITGAVTNLATMVFNGGSRVSVLGSLSGNAIFNATSSNWGLVYGDSRFNNYSYNAGTTTNATFVGDFAENFYQTTNGFVSGVKTRVYDAVNIQVNVLRNFADTAWTIVADNTIVKLLYRNLVDLFGRNQNTTTLLEEQNNGFFLKPLEPGNISSCGVLDTENATYTLTQDIFNYKYDVCFVVRANGVTLEGGGHTLNALSKDTSRYAIVATSTYSQDNTHNSFTDLSIKNITIENFAYAVNANGESNSNGDGGSGGNITVASSTLNAGIFANGGDGTANGGSGGDISITNTDMRGIGSQSAINSNGGNTSSCRYKGGDGGFFESVNSAYDLLFNNAGTGPVGNSCHVSTSGSGGQRRSSGIYVSPSLRVVSGPTPARNLGGNSAKRIATNQYGNGNIYGVDIPVVKLDHLKLKNLPTLGEDSGKSTFTFLDSINQFVFTPIPESISVQIKKIPKLYKILTDAGVYREQNRAHINVSPISLPRFAEKDVPQGLLVVKKDKNIFSGLYITSDPKYQIVELARAFTNTPLLVSVYPFKKEKVTGDFNGEKINFESKDGKVYEVSIKIPSVPGRYYVKSSASPLVLAIDVVEFPKPAVVPKKTFNILDWFVDIFY